jgi:hypothetical protein
MLVLEGPTVPCNRTAALAIRSLPKEVVPSYTEALRNEAFGFEGKMFGRTIPY